MQCRARGSRATGRDSACDGVFGLTAQRSFPHTRAGARRSAFAGCLARELSATAKRVVVDHPGSAADCVGRPHGSHRGETAKPSVAAPAGAGKAPSDEARPPSALRQSFLLITLSNAPAATVRSAA